MNKIFCAVFLLCFTLLGATPDFLSFNLMLTDVYITTWNAVETTGEFTITNHSDEMWSYMFEYPLIGNIWVDETEPPFMYFDLWTWVHIPPHDSLTWEIGGGGIPIGDGYHTAKARLFYSPVNQEPVGNTVTFSLDLTLTDIGNVTWGLALDEVGSNSIDATVTMLNDNNYPWQLEFPYAEIAVLAVDGVPQAITPTPQPHLEYLAPHQHRSFNLSYLSDGDFTPGDHTVQICALAPDPVFLGPVLTFHVQGSSTDDEISQSFAVQLVPNPISDSSILRIDSPASDTMSLCIFNLRGQKIATYSGISVKKGSNTLNWQELAGKPLASGVYLVRLAYNGINQYIKVMVSP
jgi:hypothetical protein